MSAPTNIVLDTDIWSDLDDALALAMLHALEERGEIKLLAVTISTNNRWCSCYVDLINHFYGRPSIPIGIIHEGMDIEVFRARLPAITWPFTTYTRQVSERTCDDGRLAYPRRLEVSSTVPDAVALLRGTLAEQVDESVVLVQIGFSTNLARLLNSRPDDSSGLAGHDLVARKVRLLVTMAGMFNEATSATGQPLPKGSPEFNLVADPLSAQELFANWPTQIVVSGLEVGLALSYSAHALERDYSRLPHHPLADSIRSFCKEVEAAKQWNCTLPHASSDLTAVIHAARPDQNYFSLSSPGRIIVEDDGTSAFEESPDGRHRHLIVSEPQRVRTFEAMMTLATQSPPTSPPRG